MLGERRAHARLHLRRGREAQRAQPAGAGDAAHPRPQQRGRAPQRADRRAVEHLRAAHLEQVADRVLHPAARRRAPRDAHRDPAQHQRRGQRLERRRIAAVHAVGLLEHAVDVPAGQVDRERRVAVVLADELREPPVGGRGVGREQVAEAGAVELDRRAGDHVGVDHQPLRPARLDGALDAVDQQHRLVVGEAVDAGGGLDRDVRQPEPRADDLADVDDRARADAEDQAGVGARGGRVVQRRRVGVDDAVGVAQRDPADVRACRRSPA